METKTTAKKQMIAVDLGASGGKCFLGAVSRDSFSVRELARFPYEGVSLYLPGRDGKIVEHSYWDDLYIYGNIVKSLHTFRREAGRELDSVGIDTWGADGQCLDKNGEILGSVYCYRDHRLDCMVDILKSVVDPRRVYEITGIHFQPFNQSNQLLWLKRERPEDLKRAVKFLPIPTLFYYYLGGADKVDTSWASATQLMDARTREWSAEILSAIGIPLSLMPGIVPPGTVIGSLHEELAEAVGINRANLTAVGSHDTASAFAAAPVETATEALIISSGTWSLIGKLLPAPITTDKAFSANISNEGGIGGIRFLKNCMGTWIVQELRRAWAIEDGRETDWAELISLAEKAPAFTAFIDPDNPSFYNPRDMS
ncbi:MAG: rhamnulokinase, partial [Spirochaetales bacterium]